MSHVVDPEATSVHEGGWRCGAEGLYEEIFDSSRPCWFRRGSVDDVLAESPVPVREIGRERQAEPGDETEERGATDPMVRT